MKFTETEEAVPGKERRLPSPAKSSYYTANAGLDLKPLLDMMIANPTKEYRIAYDRLAPETLELRIYYGWRWLIDNYDVIFGNTTYATLRAAVVVKKEESGIVLRRRTSHFNANNMTAYDVDKNAEQYSWREKLENFLEDITKSRIDIGNLNLDAGDRKGIENMFAGLNFLVDVTPTTVTVIREGGEQEK